MLCAATRQELISDKRALALLVTKSKSEEVRDEELLR
jgi:hypothetical protein